jgi:Sec-independent protein translocase protein TatA
VFGSLDPAKLLVILVFALIVIGPERLPKAARQLGAAWRQLTTIREQVTEEVRKAMPDLGLDDLDLPHLPRNPSAAVSNFVRDLTGSMTAAPTGGLHTVEQEAADGAGGEGTLGPGIDARVPAEGDVTAGRPRASRPQPRRLQPGETIPEHAFVVAASPERGELAVAFDDPAMN